MILTPRSAVLTVSTAIVIGLAARAAEASAINLMQSATPQAPAIDASAIRWDIDEEVSALFDDDCVAISDDRTMTTRMGLVGWRAGELMWRWDRAGDPLLVYLVCADRSARELMDGGLALAFRLTGISTGRIRATGPWIADPNPSAAPDDEASPVAVQMPTATDLLSGSLTNTPVPEPGSWLLMATGFAVAWRARRRRM